MRITIKLVMIVALSFIVCSIFFSCASIIHGTKQDVTITSSPIAADVTVKTTGGVISFTGKTPANVKLARKDAYDVFINLSGYQETKVHINKKFDALFIGNLLCGGPLGMIIDAANGAMNKLEPNAINVTLMTASIDKNTKETYAVFHAMDSEGQLRTLVIPLIKS